MTDKGIFKIQTQDEKGFILKKIKDPNAGRKAGRKG
jgi:hypothetical protein